MTRGAWIALAVAAGTLGAVLLFAVVAPPVAVFDAAQSTAQGLKRPAHLEDRDDAGALRRAAVHYDLVCAECHASPANPMRGAHLDLSPPAPRLHARIADWPASSLFKVVRDGSPGSAMPAWAAPHRADEIWPMVAFLQRLPSLDAQGYAQMAGIDGEDGEEPATLCTRCHTGTLDAAPRLDIQTPEYLADALAAYRGGTRASGYMQGIAARLEDDEIAALAGEFGKDAAPEPSAEEAPQIVARGKPDRKAGACLSCHGTGAREAFPRLAGQHEAYLVDQMHLFMDDEHPRGGGPWIGLMRHAAGDLTDAEIAEIAGWFAARK